LYEARQYTFTQIMWNIAYKFTVTNMATVRNFEIVSDKFNTEFALK